MKVSKSKLHREGQGGFIAATALILTVLMATIALVGLNLQEGTQKDSAAISEGIQAKFLAETALQEAKYYVTKVGNGWTGSSSEQTITGDGVKVGTFEYTVSNSGSTYTVVANGYVPNKASKTKVTRTLTSSFSYQGITASGGMVVLNPNAASSLSNVGNGTFTLYGGKVYVNSTSATGMDLTGRATMTASEFDLSSASFGNTGNTTIHGTVKYSQTPIPDPLANLAVPDPATLVVRSNSTLSIGSNNSATLDPGVYIGGIVLSGNAVVTLNPGIYYLKSSANGKGLSVSGNATLTANQVMIYNEGITANETIGIAGNGAITMTPPTSGTYKSILLFQSRTSTLASTIVGNAQLRMRGTLYFKAATLKISGNGSNIGSLEIADKVVISGNGAINLNNY